MYIFYRISDSTQFNLNKVRPPFFSKLKCLQNFINVFTTENLYIIADNCSENTITNIQNFKIQNDKIFKTNFGNGCASFKFAVEMVFKMKENNQINLNDLIYFVEDDYLHTPLSKEVLINGLQTFDFVTLYDHPDKYVNANTEVNKIVGNPFIKDNSEETRLYLGTFCHFKLTNSTTMTFATKVSTLYNTWNIMLPHLQTNFPYDFYMFIDLIKNNYKLASPIPSFSTHCENALMAPLIKWAEL